MRLTKSEEKERAKQGKVKWVVDECPDAYGSWTIRVADGSENGDTDQEPIATVYSLTLAEQIVSEHNAAI